MLRSEKPSDFSFPTLSRANQKAKRKEARVCIPASRGEGAGDGEENDLLAGGEGVNRDGLELVVLVEEGQVSVGNHVAYCYRSHFPDGR